MLCIYLYISHYAIDNICRRLCVICVYLLSCVWRICFVYVFFRIMLMVVLVRCLCLFVYVSVIVVAILCVMMVYYINIPVYIIQLYVINGLIDTYQLLFLIVI